MIPDNELLENGILIVTGSSLRAERADRPLAYHLKKCIDKRLRELELDGTLVVLSDLWYLNAEALHQMPLISVGGPGTNAVSAYLYRKLSNALVIDDTLTVQMDVELKDLRVSLWGVDHDTTARAVEIFLHRDYLDRFLGAVVAA
ncbi:MAG: hypothetical protein K9M57_09370 [Phycisphaerae bacterium]|nr:hypothetical protein [Phycisphaerae bacterium]